MLYYLPLDPNICKEGWTYEEELLLLSLFKSFETQWKKYQSSINNRPPHNIQDHFFSVLLRELRDNDQNILEEIKNIWDIYNLWGTI